jgi:metal-responsive CopG/Arc/MetJ family transcriptional regulator
MKTLEVPENLFEQFEAYRRSKHVSRSEAFKELLQQARLEEKWWREMKRRPAGAPELSEDEADALAVEAVREYRRSRRNAHE